MNPLIRKEIRILLPAWVAALVAATMPLWPWQNVRDDWFPWFFVFSAAIFALALSPFGQEMSCGTFSLLLVQPEERKRFWRIKTGLLALAMLSAGALFFLCLILGVTHPIFERLFKTTVLLTLLAFVGGLWSTLLLRDIVAAFFCAWLLPMVILAGTAVCVGHWIDFDGKTFALIVYCELIVYLAVGFFWARWLFLRAQDVGWTGGQISLMSVRGVSLRWLAFDFKSGQNRWTALAKKELQLHEITMFLVPALLLLHLVVLALHYLFPQRITNDAVPIIPFLGMAILPFVIGCVAVAEERRFNTLDGLLCLPISKRASFAVKFSVALVLGIVLGGFVPWLVLKMSATPQNFNFPLRAAVIIAGGITAISFYASSMSRGLLQALPTTLCIAGLTGTIVGWVSMTSFFGPWEFVFFQSSLFPTLAVPTVIITLVWLAFGNYKRSQIGWQVWLGDFTRAGAVAGCMTLVAVAIFDRSWQLFLPLEPRHGQARIVSYKRTDIGVSMTNVCVLLPDGRLWVGKERWVGKRENRRLKNVSGGFADGTNWMKLAVNYTSAAALQTDGTLWKINDGSDIRQIGSDSDWNEVAGGGGTFLAIKSDGTLWGWGHDAAGIFSERSINNSHAISVPDPIRLGTNSDWEKVFFLGSQQTLGVKRDGSTWKWGNLELSGHRWVASMRQMVPGKIDGHNLLNITPAGAGDLTLFIRTDGSLWAVGDFPSEIFGEKVLPASHQYPERIGTKSDWIALSGQWQPTALEANGSIWTMSFESGDNPTSQSKRPSKYTDWVAATEFVDLTWGLARDGTLSCWNEFGVNWPDHNTTFMHRFYLGPTRRPLLSCNILDKQ